MTLEVHMTIDERFQMLTEMADVIAALMGSETEVAIHDIEKREIYYIVNGNLTGRAKGYKINDATFDTVLELVDTKGRLIGYGSMTSTGRRLRSSHFIFRDENNKPYAMMCVNQDTTDMYNVRDAIDRLISIKSLTGDGMEEYEKCGENYVQAMTRKAIIESFERVKPANTNTKEGKLLLIKTLKDQGIFDVKDSVQQVCEALSISQATLYNYLREIKSE